jgi:hypothetical protein
LALVILALMTQVYAAFFDQTRGGPCGLLVRGLQPSLGSYLALPRRGSRTTPPRVELRTLKIGTQVRSTHAPRAGSP